MIKVNFNITFDLCKWPFNNIQVSLKPPALMNQVWLWLEVKWFPGKSLSRYKCHRWMNKWNDGEVSWWHPPLRLEPLPGLLQLVKGHLHLLVGVVCGLQLLGQLLAALVGLLQGRRVVLRLLLGISQLQMQATRKYIHVYILHFFNLSCPWLRQVYFSFS